LQFPLQTTSQKPPFQSLLDAFAFVTSESLCIAIPPIEPDRICYDLQIYAISNWAGSISSMLGNLNSLLSRQSLTSP
jgi:hypothetical protein